MLDHEEEIERRVRADEISLEQLEDEGPVRRDRMFLPLVSKDLVPPGGYAHVEAHPQLDMRMHYVCIAPDLSEHFDVWDVRVGNYCSFAAVGPITGLRVIEIRTEVRVGSALAIKVKNRSNAPRTFVGGAVGTTSSYGDGLRVGTSLKMIDRIQIICEATGEPVSRWLSRAVATQVLRDIEKIGR